MLPSLADRVSGEMMRSQTKQQSYLAARAGYISRIAHPAFRAHLSVGPPFLFGVPMLTLWQGLFIWAVVAAVAYWGILALLDWLHTRGD